MNPKEFQQKSELAKATFNAMALPTYENVSKFTTELVKTDIEYSQLSDRDKEILKLWKDIGHELFSSHNYDKVRLLYTQLDNLLMHR